MEYFAGSLGNLPFVFNILQEEGGGGYSSSQLSVVGFQLQEVNAIKDDLSGEGSSPAGAELMLAPGVSPG
jgi:hypothetical protein